MKKSFKIILIVVGILILVPVIVFVGPWIALAAILFFAPGEIVFTEHLNCIPAVTLTSTSESPIYKFSNSYSQNYSSFEIGVNDRYISLNTFSDQKDKAVLLPEGTELHLDGYAVHRQPTGKEIGFSSESYTFRGSIGEDTVWISDSQLGYFQGRSSINAVKHAANSRVLRSLGFVEFENEYVKYLKMPDDWSCLE